MITMQILLADADVNVLAVFSLGAMAAVVWFNIHEYREVHRMRRRLERERKQARGVIP